MKIVSIAVLTYNSEHVIKPCLDSIFKQRYKDLEVIVVDNGSDDSTLEIVKKDYPDVILIENRKNLGASKARNQAIAIARHEWILTLDSDVNLREDFLSNALVLLENMHADVGIIQPKILHPDKKRIYSCGLYLSWMRRFFDIGKDQRDTGQYDNVKEAFGACSAAAFYRRSMLNDIKESTGYFDERFFFLVEDVDLAWRAQKKRWKALFLPELICYHSGNSSLTNSKMRQYLCFRNRYLMIAKNQGWKSYALRVLPILFYDIPRWIYLLIANPYFRRKRHSEERRSLGSKPGSFVASASQDDNVWHRTQDDSSCRPEPFALLEGRLREGSKKKKILLFNSGSLLYGSEKGLLNIIKALRGGYEITVVLPESGPLVGVIRKSGIKVKIFPLSILSLSFSPLYYIKFFLLGIADIVYFCFYARQNSIDIIYTNNAMMIFPSIIALLLKKAHIWHIREFFHINFINIILAYIIRRFSLRIICQSENIRKTLFPVLDKRIEVIYEAMEPVAPGAVNIQNLRRKLKISPDTIVMSIVSRIHPHKGQFEFIESMLTFLRQKDSNAVLLLAGDISPRNLRTHFYKKKIESIIKENNLQKKIMLLGFIYDTSIIFGLTDLAIFPLRRNEPFGIALLEALASSCQVFVSPNPGSSEVISFFKEPYNKLHPKLLSDIIRSKDIKKRRPDFPEAFLFETYKNKMLVLMKGIS